MNQLATVLLAMLLLWPCVPAANPGIKDDAPPTGSHIRRTIAEGWVLPYDKTYAQLSEEELAVLRSAYEGLSARDEPPFPVDGLGKIVRQIAEAQQTLLVRGRAAGFAVVDASGDVQSVQFFEVPDGKMAQVISLVYMQAKFKPALCEGVACEMEFPIAMHFKLR